MSRLANFELQHARRDAEKVSFGFWVYLMTDCVLFAALFAVYAVLHGNAFGGKTAGELFAQPYALTETLLLLTSSFTCGLALLAAQKHEKDKVVLWLSVTMALGSAFLVMEFSELHKLAIEGNSWHRSGFLSSYFTLVGTHGLHIIIGLIWMTVMALFISAKGLTRTALKRLTLLSMFWHFLDVVWIFIFTIVYLFGARGV